MEDTQQDKETFHLYIPSIKLFQISSSNDDNDFYYKHFSNIDYYVFWTIDYGNQITTPYRSVDYWFHFFVPNIFCSSPVGETMKHPDEGLNQCLGRSRTP